MSLRRAVLAGMSHCEPSGQCQKNSDTDGKQQYAEQGPRTDAGDGKFLVKSVLEGDDAGRQGRGHGRFQKCHPIGEPVFSQDIEGDQQQKGDEKHSQGEAGRNGFAVTQRAELDPGSDEEYGEGKGCPAEPAQNRSKGSGKTGFRQR